MQVDRAQFVPDLGVALGVGFAVTLVGLAGILENAGAAISMAVAQLEPRLGMALVRRLGEPLDGFGVASLAPVSVVVEVSQFNLRRQVALFGCPGKPGHGLTPALRAVLTLESFLAQLKLGRGIPFLGGLFQVGNLFALVGLLWLLNGSLRKQGGGKQAGCEPQNHKIPEEIHGSTFPKL